MQVLYCSVSSVHLRTGKVQYEMGIADITALQNNLSRPAVKIKAERNEIRKQFSAVLTCNDAYRQRFLQIEMAYTACIKHAFVIIRYHKSVTHLK